MRGWNAPASGPNAALSGGLATLRNRCRDATRNDAHASAIVDRLVSSIIGTGIVPRPQTDDPALRSELQTAWTAWIRVADADGVLDFYGLQSLVMRSMLESGEVFIRLCERTNRPDLPAGLQLQVLESDLLPIGYNMELPDGARIVDGIELSKYGERLAYWLHRSHPGEAQSTINAEKLLRIPADQVLHVFEPTRPGQLRGAPLLAPVLARLRNLSDFDDAVLERQKLANLFTLFITRPLPTGLDDAIDPLTGKTVEFDGLSGAPLAMLEPGISQELLPGEDVKFSAPPGAGADYGVFMKH
jgi:lambda family phage portal protein